jgi:hypothetical protein
LSSTRLVVAPQIKPSLQKAKMIMRIAYYITGHGYGHGIRSCAVCNSFSPAVELTVRSALPEAFFREEISRPFDYVPAAFDCGCVQRNGVEADVPATLRLYREIAQRNRDSLPVEVGWCRGRGIEGVVSDITPFAFEVAHAAGIRSIGVSNFSWFDIYEAYLPQDPGFGPTLQQIRRQYAHADLLIALQPANAMSCFGGRRVPMGPIGRLGRDRSAEIRARFGVAPHKKLALVYTGNYGLDAVAWARLEQFAEWEFFGIHPLPCQPSNFHLFSKEQFSYQEMSASMDCLVAKLGYGVYAECLLNGLPLLYLPREDFAEYPVLAGGIREWGGGVCLSSEAFHRLDWATALASLSAKPRPAPRANAAGLCSRTIEDFLQK